MSTMSGEIGRSEGGNGTAKGAKPWTDGEKIHFLMQVVDQLCKSGASVKYELLDMPGRTPKSMTHMMAKFRTEAAAFRKGGDGSPVATTPKSGKKGTASAGTSDGLSTGSPSALSGRKRIKSDPDGAGIGDPVTPSPKKARTTAQGSARRATASLANVKAESDLEDELYTQSEENSTKRGNDNGEI
ncbi:hypothetical protein GGS23DRAFT_545761 [Durotheca rogersii]|uniref:uncharacterized protein n=1 Tax=Durotheca rogersii TaxID=419775 RepID=UPI002220B553|nr:uncharacterized protein GGS23DRAFT_545761 [Durotheca rogersii]KAI5868481.1 hypothetical protein GGS23DRAFT_545761 [Durotheca rogersii]